MTEANLAELPDEALVHRCRILGAKDDRPFAELFKRHRAAMWRICFYFVSNALDAEDMVQEIFFKAYRGLSQFEGRALFRTWLNQISINTCKNELRLQSRRPVMEEAELEIILKPTEATAGPDQRWLAEMEREELAEALTSLPPDQFTALQLRDLEGRSYAEVAQILGISQSAAKMRVQRARLNLGVALRQMNQGEGMT